MRLAIFIVIAAAASTTTTCVSAADPELEEEELRGRRFMQEADRVFSELATKSAIASWNYNTNITVANQEIMLNEAIEGGKELKHYWEALNQFDWRRFSDKDLKRQFKQNSILGISILPDDKYKKLSQVINSMRETYSTAKICDNKNNCNLPLSPDVETIMANSNDTELLKHIWIEWRNAVGPRVKHLYKEHVELSNEAARLNNFSDTGTYWLDNYETPDIKEQVAQLWANLKPLYMQLHAYIRFRLRKRYGDMVTERGPIPAHLLGNMWAQTWEHLHSFTKPFDGTNTPPSITNEMVNQGYDTKRIFKTAENFFTSLGLPAMNEMFWKKSMLEKPKDREAVCHGSAFDFADKKNFRIKMCTKIIEEDLITAHHEMGHVEYYMHYKDQPYVYRSGANEGFHEAIGDTISLSVRTSKHLKNLGLIESEGSDDEVELNQLYKTALSKLPLLPFSYILDLWRWDVYAGKITPNEYNCKFWKLAEEYQGIEPPVDRTEKDFDVASKFHIVAYVPYLRYFVSTVIQFQFHRALCLKAGQYVPNDPNKPLYNCDIYGNKAAGDVFGKMLSMGSSRPWQDAMEVLTGQRTMDAGGILEYFKPLQNWLDEEIRKNDIYVGWEPSKKMCVKSKKDLLMRNGQN